MVCQFQSFLFNGLKLTSQIFCMSIRLTVSKKKYGVASDSQLSLAKKRRNGYLQLTVTSHFYDFWLVTVKIIINYFTYVRNICFIKHRGEFLFRLAHINSIHNKFNSRFTYIRPTPGPTPPPPPPQPRLPRLFQFYNNLNS